MITSNIIIMGKAVVKIRKSAVNCFSFLHYAFTPVDTGSLLQACPATVTVVCVETAGISRLQTVTLYLSRLTLDTTASVLAQSRGVVLGCSLGCTYSTRRSYVAQLQWHDVYHKLVACDVFVSFSCLYNNSCGYADILTADYSTIQEGPFGVHCLFG